MTAEDISKLRASAAARLNCPTTGKIVKNVSRQLVQVCDFTLSLLKQ